MTIAGSTIDLATVPNATLDVNGNLVEGLVALAGQGTFDMTLKSYKAVTDATARRIALYALDPATDTEYIVANVVPDGAVPKFTMRAPDDVPSTSELDDEHITFSYVKATNTLSVHRNEGGVIVSAAVAVLV